MNISNCVKVWSIFFFPKIPSRPVDPVLEEMISWKRQPEFFPRKSMKEMAEEAQRKAEEEREEQEKQFRWDFIAERSIVGSVMIFTFQAISFIPIWFLNFHDNIVNNQCISIVDLCKHFIWPQDFIDRKKRTDLPQLNALIFFFIIKKLQSIIFVEFNCFIDRSLRPGEWWWLAAKTTVVCWW